MNKNDALRIKKGITMLFLTAFSFLVFFPSLLFSQNINKGYFNRTKLALLPGVGDNGSAFHQSGTEISNVNGWYVNSRLALGIGVGIVPYVNPTITTIPVFGNVNYSLRDKKSTPYLFGNLGYSFLTNSHTSGGLLAEIGTGWQFKLGRKSFIGPEIGYRHQKYRIQYYDGPDGSVGDQLNALSIGVTIRF